MKTDPETYKADEQTILKKVLEVCYDIEQLPASYNQTRCSVLASDLRQAVDKLCQQTGASQQSDVVHHRLVRPLAASGIADCPKCGAKASVARHNADWTCHKCGFHEIVDTDREAV